MEEFAGVFSSEAKAASRVAGGLGLYSPAESRLAEAHGDEPPGGDAAEWVLARLARSQEEGKPVAPFELQP